MWTFAIFEHGTVAEHDRRGHVNTLYKIKSDVGSCTLFPMWGHPYAKEYGCTPVWGIADVKRTRLGEALSQLMHERAWFLYDRGGTRESYRAFYEGQYPQDQTDLIFEADRAAYESKLECVRVMDRTLPGWRRGGKYSS